MHKKKNTTTNIITLHYITQGKRDEGYVSFFVWVWCFCGTTKQGRFDFMMGNRQQQRQKQQHKG